MNCSVSWCPYLKTVPPVKWWEIWEKKNSGRKGFTCGYPPTGEQAILQYYGYMSKIRASGRQPTTFEAVLMVTSDIMKWWEKVGVKLKHELTIKFMVRELIKDYKDLFRRKDREVGKEKKKRKLS